MTRGNLLDADNTTVTLQTMGRAAAALGKELKIALGQYPYSPAISSMSPARAERTRPRMRPTQSQMR